MDSTSVCTCLLLLGALQGEEEKANCPFSPWPQTSNEEDDGAAARERNSSHEDGKIGPDC